MFPKGAVPLQKRGPAARMVYIYQKRLRQTCPEKAGSVQGLLAHPRGGHAASDISVRGRNGATAQLLTVILAAIRSPGKSAMIESII